MIKKKLSSFKNQFPYLKFLFKFLGSYLLLHLLYLCIVSASHPNGKLYSPFVIKYFNILEWLRSFLLFVSKLLFGVVNIEANRIGANSFYLVTGGHVNVNNGCLGFGVLSFWCAFIYANENAVLFKVKWLLYGIGFICLLNISRIMIILFSFNQHWKSIVNIDQHTIFNVIAYILIFVMIYFYDKSSKKQNLNDFNT